MPVYKDKKNNTWYAKFNYKNWKGETHYTTKRGFSTKREAVEYEREFKLRVAGNLDMTFEEFIALYREDRYPRIRVSTTASKDHIIDTKIVPYFKNHRVTEIKAKDIIKWQNELLSYRNPNSKVNDLMVISLALHDVGKIYEMHDGVYQKYSF